MRAAILLVPVAIFTISVVWKGIPSVRHDWSWIADRGALLNNLADQFSGWNSLGLGQPQLHATTQLQVAVTWILAALTGSRAAFGIEVFLIGLACAYAGCRLAAAWTDDAVIAFGAALLAVLNPWTYTETVAGHIYMIAAYAGLLLLVRELVGPKTNRYVVAFAVMLCSLQLQFLLVVLAVLVIWCAFRREPRLGLATAVVLMSPAIVGVLGDRAAFVDVPHNLFWLQTQSLDARDAVTLLGYFAHYTATLAQPTIAALWVVVVIAAFGAAVALRRRWLALLPAFMLFVWLVVMGLKGPFNGMFAVGIDRFPELGVYRELYDLVAFLLVGYVALGSLACARVVRLRWFWALSAAVIAAYWITSPPSRLWVSADAIPQASVSAQPGTRFALLPAFQPLAFRGQGSGLDPAAYIRPGNVVPLNTESPGYPIDVAFAAYEQHGDASGLAALSVSDIVVQPWMQSLTADIDLQRATRMPVPHPPVARAVPGYIPEMTLSPLPRVSLVGNHLGYGEVFFSDVAGLTGDGVPAGWSGLPAVRPIDVVHDRLSASEGWVDARLAFASQPELGQGLGGVLTTSSSAVLPIDPAAHALVYVRGALLSSDGRRLVSSTHGYAWIALPAGTTAVRCAGECVVAAVGDPPPRLPAEPPVPAPWTRVAATTTQPWLAFATIPAAGAPAMLRYNVRFDPGWIALDGWTELPHFRVDTSVNGWILPPRPTPRRVVVLEPTAMIQSLLALLGVAWSLYVLIRFGRDRFAERSRYTRDPRTNRVPDSE